MLIAVDFDGTCVSHAYPNIGHDIGAVEVLQNLVNHGHKIILNTMRSGELLEKAVSWFTENGIELYGVNENPGQKTWTSSPKVFANLYIDDAALGCPIVCDPSISDRAFVDWKTINNIFKENGIL